MTGRSLAMLLMGLGVLLVAVGALVWVGGLSWFGRLPGDIRIERPQLRVYVPLTSMLVVSVVVSGVLALLKRVR
ncbi:MAG: DUF2905 domain-containing protein [bacterium]